MKGRRPHIILRFSGQVPPASKPPPPPPSVESASSGEDSLADSLGRKGSASAHGYHPTAESLSIKSTMPRASRAARKNPPAAGGGTTSAPRSVQGEPTRENSQPAQTSVKDTTISHSHSHSHPDSETPRIIFTGKRKREIPQSIGGGKGDLKPPPAPNKRPKKGNVPGAGNADHTEKPEDKRVLRSQDTEKKGEWDLWFNGYEVAYDEQIEILKDGGDQETDDRTKWVPTNPEPESPLKLDPRVERAQKEPIVLLSLEEEFKRLHPGKPLPGPVEDPLDDSIYLEHRAWGLKQEKQGKALHHEKLAYENQQREQALEKLEGSDWIKALKISPKIVTQVPRPVLEERRQRLMKWLKNKITIHYSWKETERRKKKLGLNCTPEDEVTRSKGGRIAVRASDELRKSVERTSSYDHTDAGEDSTPAGSIAKETARKRSKRKSDGDTIKPNLKEPELEFTSFYSRPYLRQQALSSWRKSSRTQTAFGVSLPMVEEKEFSLPDDIIIGGGHAKAHRARKRSSRE